MRIKNEPSWLVLATTVVVMLLDALSVVAQVSNSQTCRGTIYTQKQVAKPAKLIDQPNFKALFEALGNRISARVTLEAVLCRSGHITDIRVINSQPPNAGEFVVAALSMVRFRPAELNWHTVSERQQFEFHIGDDWKFDAIDAKAAAGRLVEELDIIGNRRMTKEQVLESIKTRPGDLYNSDQIRKDLAALLGTGYFSPKGTLVRLEEGVRGGVSVAFEVVELPTIKQIKFAGLSEVEQSAEIEDFIAQRTRVRRGAPVDAEEIHKAAHQIDLFLKSKGWRAEIVEPSIESLSATEVSITFRITASKVRR